MAGQFKNKKEYDRAMGEVEVRIEYADGSIKTCDDVFDAEIEIENSYPDAVYGDWIRMDGDHPYRKLVWENEDIAGEPGTGDDGSHAIAEIVEIRE